MLAYLIALSLITSYTHTHTQPSELNEVDTKHLVLINHYTNKFDSTYILLLIEYLLFV